MGNLAPENEQPGIITDHKFLANPEWGGNWGRCVRCDLAEAAHQAAETPYVIPASSQYRCPDCVTKDIDPCVHNSS